MTTQTSAQWSVALVVGGALLMAAKGIVTKWLYRSGIQLEALLLLRALMSLPLIWGWAWWRGELKRVMAAPRAVLSAAALGGLSGYYVGTWCDFRALQLIDASLERVLLFTYPAMVVLARALWARRAPQLREVAAVSVTYAGVLLAVGGFDTGLWQANETGAVLVLSSAALFAGYLFANEYAASRIGGVGFLVVAATSAAAALTGHFLVTSTGAALSLPPQVWWSVLLMTAFTNVVPLFMLSAGVGQLGAARAAVLTSVGPPATLFLAWWWLGESMRGLQLVGSLLCVSGVLILEVGRKRTAAP